MTPPRTPDDTLDRAILDALRGGPALSATDVLRVVFGWRNGHKRVRDRLDALAARGFVVVARADRVLTRAPVRGAERRRTMKRKVQALTRLPLSVYTFGRQLVLTGDPPREGHPAARTHHCDEMGCGTVHVLVRVPLPADARRRLTHLLTWSDTAEWERDDPPEGGGS